jgi:hypothetical protein
VSADAEMRDAKQGVAPRAFKRQKTSKAPPSKLRQHFDKVTLMQNRKMDEYSQYVSSLSEHKVRRKSHKFEYVHTGLYLSNALSVAARGSLPETFVDIVRYNPQTRELSMRFKPNGLSLQRVRALVSRPEFEPRSVYISDPTANAHLYGIEAAELCLEMELSRAIQALGNISPSHIECMSRVMTRTGNLVTQKNNGFKRTEHNPFERGTFESNGINFMQDTLGKSSKDAGINFRMVAGSAPRIGTHYYDLVSCYS